MCRNPMSRIEAQITFEDGSAWLDGGVREGIYATTPYDAA